MLSILAVAIKEDRVINGSFLSDNPPGTEKKMPPSLSELLTLLFTLLPKPSSLHSASSLGHSQNLKFKKSDLEKEIEETNEEKKEIIAFGYNFAEEEFLSQGQYPSLPLDYVKMFYGENKKKPLAFESEDEYWTEAALADVENDMLTTSEAKETFLATQYVAAAGAWSETNIDKKRRLDLWIKVNAAMFAALHTLYAFTGDVNYSA